VSATAPTDLEPPELFLSLVTPVFNGAAFIEGSVREILRALEALGEPFELIVVDDGSRDGTADAVRRIEDPRVRLIAHPVNEGKGNAITHGLAAARGRLVGWLDADLDIEPEVIVRAAHQFEREPVDAVIGSKRHGASAVDYPAIRRVYSAGFQLLVATLFRINVKDTQVGAKVFRRELIDVVRPLLLIKRYAFDLEVLAVGAEFGFTRVREIPIELNYRFTGTQINWRAVRAMLLDTLAIAYRIHVRHWYVRRFASLQRHRMDELSAHPDAAPELSPEELIAP
jgi:glycosyltransferase involved in cell wall biosynthesis